MLPTIKQIREANGGLDNLTDFEIAQYQHQQYKAYVPDFNRFAEMVGVDPGTKWGNRLSASVDNYQANLSGVVEEVTGSTTMRNWREENERQARNAQQFAASQGAIMSMGDIESVGDVPEWVGGLAIDSAPYLLESAVGGLAVRGLSTGLRGTIAAGQAADASVDAIRAAQAARKAMAVRTTAGGVLASYPSAVGDILQNQRHEAGETNLGSAALGGIPYAGLNALGLEGAAARGGLRRGINLLDEGLDSAKGLRGAALRTAVNGTRVGMTEGLSETGQEMVNQSFGRMAVNPDQTLFNPEANDRYIESFAGGFALGGSMSAATGGWRRSEGYQPPAAPIDENGGVNLLNGQPLNPPAPVVNPGANAPLADVINQRVGLDLSRKPVKGYESAFEAAATEPSGVRAVDPATGQEYEMTQAEYLEREAAQRNDAFAQQLAAEQAALAEDKAKIEARNAVREEAKGLGITGSKGIDLYLELKQALEDGVISEADFRETRVQLGERKNNQVAKFIKAAYAQADATQTAKAQTEADAIAAVQNTTPEARSISDQEADAMAAEWEAALAEQAALAAKQGEVTDVQARDVQPATNTQVPERRNWSDAPGAVAGIAPDKTVEVGRSGRKKALTPAQVLEKIKKASPLNKMRILAATGMDMVADPTTGAPKLVISGNPMTLDEIADAESEATGKKVSKQAISQTLADAGIDADVATQVASTGNGQVYTEADLEIGPTEEGVREATGFRIEDTASKAANQGLIYDEVTGNAELTKVANALLQGKMTPEAAAQAVEGKTSKTTAARDVKPENAVTTSVEMPTTDTTKSDTVVTDLRDLTDSTIEQNIRDILDGHPERENATADWGSTKVPWDTLPDTFRADWIEQYGEIVDQFDGDLNQAAFRLLDAIQANIEDSYSDYIKYKGQQAPTGASPEALPGGESRVGMVAGAEEARPAIRDEGPAQAGRAEGPAAEPVENTSAEDQRVAQENAAKAKVVVKKKRTIQKPVEAEVREATSAPVAEAEPAPAPRNATPGSVAAWVTGNPTTAQAGPGFTAADIVSQPAPAEQATRPEPRNTTSGTPGARMAGQPTTAQAGPGFTTADVVKQPSPAEQAVIEETVGAEVAQLPEPQVRTLEAHYGAKRGTVDFLVKVKEDIVAFAVNGAQAIAAKVRHIIRKLYAAVVAGAFIFNPTTLSNVGVVSSDFEGWTVRDIQAAVPQSVRGKMSPGAQQAYATILPSIRAQLQRENKLMLVVDKPTARMFVFKPDGSPLLDKKILLGATKGDLYKGNTDVKANRITPAGLFTMGLRDARRSPGEARTAGEYDTGTVFVLDKAIDGEYSVTLFHSVWTKEADAKQRLNALKTDNPADSRYSFGCINVDKETYLRLLKEHGGQMDGAALFIVPESQKDTAEFLKGNTAQNKSGADELTRTPFKTQTEVVPATRFSKGGANSKVTPTGVKTGNTVSQVKDAVNALFPERVRDRAYEDRVKVHQSEADAVAAVGGKISADEMVGAQGFVDPTDDRIIHLVADNLPKGRELGVLLHEVGVHVGLTKKFKGAFKVLADQVQSWADAPRGSLERRIYEAAKARVDSANPDAAERSEELVAYAAEEAVSEGVMPNARGVNERVAKWLQNALSYMRNMVRDFLGFQPSAALTPQDLVDFAYGAARDTLGTVVVERAAMQGEPVTDKQLLQYYAKGEDIYDSAQILHHVGPGQEFINWGPESTYGPHQGVTTAGYIYAQAAGFNPEADSGIQELEEVIPHPDTGIQVFAMMLTSDAVQRRAFETGLSHMLGEQTLATLEAWYVGAGNWSVVVRGPDPDSLLYKHLESLGQVKMSEPDMYGDRWSTLTGIENGDTQELLSEFRRRLTRALGGEVPGVMFTRATGAAVGKEGEYSPATVRRRFSKAAPSVAQQLGPQYAKAESVIKQAIGDLKTTAVKYGAFTRDLIDQAAKYMPAARQYLANYEAVATDRTRMEQKVDAILERFGALSTHERTRINELIRSSTMSKEWAFKPDWLKDAKYDENSTLAVQFRALTPAQRSVVQDVFRHGHETLEAMQKAVKDNVNSEFDVLIKGFKDAGNDAEAAKAEARKVKALQEFSSMLEMNGNWPYAPLRRFGDHVVVAKSAAYRAAEKAKDAAAIKNMEADENHYYVEFFESRGEARKKVADMQASGKYAGGVVENFNKGEANEQLYGGRDTFNAFRRLRNLVNETGGASLTEPANATINSLMNDLYLSLLGERSARQAERNRKNTAGADRDMMRAFATKGRADAHFIASLRFGGQVQEDLLKMKDQADNNDVGTRELRREFFNEILARHTMQMDFQSTPVVDKVMSFSSFFQLLVNPAYYLQNVMQPWVMSLPMLAGKHGYGKSWGALSKAYRDLLPLLKDGNFSKGDYDALPRDVQAIVKELAARGRIEISLEHDLGRWRSNADDGVATRYFVAAREKLRKANTQIEMVNRLATAIAAARLEGVGNAKAATDYADRVIIGTHGDYNAFNAPRLMRTPLGRMATQFRKFQLIQITMYTKLISDAFKGASVQERQAARLALAYNVGHMAALGGAMGLPGFQLFSMILGAVFGDDDEPDDAEATMRRVLGNGPVADMLIRGAPNAAGVDISGKVGSGNMLSLFPYSDWDLSSRDGYMNLLAAAAGPFVGGLMPRMAEGIGNMSRGDYLKGLEKFLPGAVGNAIKGTRFAVEGVTTTKGDMVMSPDEVTWVDGLFQAAGLPTSTLTERNFRSSAEYKASKFFDEKSSEIKRSYVEAFQDNDTEAMAEARQDWLDMQATRRRLGMTVQPLSQLIKAPQERRKRERAAVGGVATDRETQGFVRQFTE